MVNRGTGGDPAMKAAKSIHIGSRPMALKPAFATRDPKVESRHD
jgi:hypothetical protein